MPLIVQKYGGTSLSNLEKIKNVAERVISEYLKGNQIVVVVSAMGDTTDRLVELMKGLTSNPSPREADVLLATGEQVSIALLSMAIQDRGYSAISLTGSQVKITTNDRHSRAEIKSVDNQRILNELNEDKIVVVAGFQGVNSHEDFTTLGRGGSDTTAVALAVSLEAERCEIYSDVDGIYTTDPRLVPEAEKMDYISFSEMLELASLGAKVLHPRSVELAKVYDLELYIASSFNQRPGTVVRRIDKMEERKNVTGVTGNKDEIMITVKRVPDKPGIAGILFSRLAERGFNVDMITQNIKYEDNLTDITFTIDYEGFLTGQEFIKEIARGLSAEEIKIDPDVAKVSIVGAGMITTPGIAARMFEALGESNINIQIITTSDIKVSCLVAEDDADKAVMILHKCFELDMS